MKSAERSEFIAFLQRLASNQSRDSDWQHYAVRHYGDDALEEARREVVRLFGRGGDESGATSSFSLEQRRVMVARLAEQLDA